MGTTRLPKGLNVLVQAIQLLPKPIRQQCQFIVRAAGQITPFKELLRSYPEVTFLGGYTVSDLVTTTTEYEVDILPHLWFEIGPLVLLEHLHKAL